MKMLHGSKEVKDAIEDLMHCIDEVFDSVDCNDYESALDLVKGRLKDETETLISRLTERMGTSDA